MRAAVCHCAPHAAAVAPQHELPAQQLHAVRARGVQVSNDCKWVPVRGVAGHPPCRILAGLMRAWLAGHRPQQRGACRCCAWAPLRGAKDCAHHARAARRAGQSPQRIHTLAHAQLGCFISLASILTWALPRYHVPLLWMKIGIAWLAHTTRCCASRAVLLTRSEHIVCRYCLTQAKQYHAMAFAEKYSATICLLREHTTSSDQASVSCDHNCKDTRRLL